jgi:hypothetical protein
VVIDPGGVCGWAVFTHGRLTACGYGKFEKVLELPLTRARVGVFLVEIPVAYSGRRSKTNPNNLIRTMARGGEFKYKFRLQGLAVEEVVPNRWKGNIPKPAKGETYIIETRVLSRLDEREKRLLYQTKSARAKRLDHNLIDAVYMGLWRLGRRE